MIIYIVHNIKKIFFHIYILMWLIFLHWKNLKYFYNLFACAYNFSVLCSLKVSKYTFLKKNDLKVCIYNTKKILCFFLFFSAKNMLHNYRSYILKYFIQIKIWLKKGIFHILYF
ncbi:hypothetical protein EDEG_00316 [Edhazardia aedis USNM 41457]|uniref:Uncharacterized protein n=1 Tax=Edhazardia aedis (strain USNM 41457) TaxID=1003232 RepID=J9DH89_EDHAE|nr:hypothetical protein EDEG_00316 [Edhazardia aedis USNM 41457]|eukprot:EJW01970.1 hypothetical protein EDEG_00316 [Edhazardia aedis USNM 41457]